MALVADWWHPELRKRLFLGLLLGAPSPIIFFLQLYALASAVEEGKALDGGVVGSLFIVLAVFEDFILVVGLAGPFCGLFGAWVELKPRNHCISCLILLPSAGLAVAYVFMITGDEEPGHKLVDLFKAGELPEYICYSFVAAIVSTIRFFLLLILGFWDTPVGKCLGFWEMIAWECVGF